MKRRTLIVEVTAKIPFDEEANEIYDAISPEEQQRRLEDVAAVSKQYFEDEGAEVVANVYVKEDDE